MSLFKIATPVPTHSIVSPSVPSPNMRGTACLPKASSFRLTNSPQTVHLILQLLIFRGFTPILNYTAPTQQPLSL